MILIIDTYHFPHELIQKAMHLKESIGLDEAIIKSKDFVSKNYFIHTENINNLSLIKYYFDEVYEIQNDKLYYFNKKKNSWKIFLYKNEKFIDEKSITEVIISDKNSGRDDVLKYFSNENGENKVIRDIDDEEY